MRAIPEMGSIELATSGSMTLTFAPRVVLQRLNHLLFGDPIHVER